MQIYHDKNCAELKDIVNRWEKVIYNNDYENEAEFMDHIELYLSRALINVFGEYCCKKVGGILTIMTSDYESPKRSD